MDAETLYLNETFYNQCLEYIKLYLVINELLNYKEYNGLREGLIKQVRLLLTEIIITLQKMQQNNTTRITTPHFDTFNYEFLNANTARVTMINNEEFQAHVNADDVEMLDDVLNMMANHIQGLQDANNNLVNKLTKANKFIKKELDDNENNNNSLKIIQEIILY